MAQAEAERFEVSGEALLKKAKEIINEGNVRRIIIQKDEKTIAEFPLTVGVVGAIVAPVLAAIGVIAALVTECTLVVERSE